MIYYRVTFQDAPPDELTAAELTTWSESHPWHLPFKVETFSAPKRCVKCGRNITKPYLVDDEPERCARCGDS